MPTAAFNRLAVAMTSAAAAVYRPGYCNESVAGLIGSVMTPTERDDAFVLVIIHGRAVTPELYWKRIFNLRPRATYAEGTLWKHHSAVLLRGGVYDYDYRGLPGTPLADYVRDMFSEAAARYMVRPIPATDYLRLYKVKDMAFYGDYPRSKLDTYVAGSQGPTTGK